MDRKSIQDFADFFLGHAWDARYFLTDDSAVEQKAVRLAFPGLLAGETEVDHLLCRVHCERTINRNLAGNKNKACRNHLFAALCTRRTIPGCKESVLKSMETAPDEETRKYIRNNWYPTQAQWGNAYREHSPLLMQVSGFFFPCKYTKPHLIADSEHKRRRSIPLCTQIRQQN